MTKKDPVQELGRHLGDLTIAQELSLQPSVALQQHLKELGRVNETLSEAFASQNQIIEAMRFVDPFQQIRADIAAMNDLGKQLTSWQEALDIQKNFGLPDHIQELTAGYTLPNEIVEPLSHRMVGRRIEILTTALRQPQLFRGEYELEDDGADSSKADGSILLPRDIRESYESVNFLPVRMLQRIYSDPSLMRNIPASDFEYFVAELIEKLGFENVEVTPRTGDGGRDIIAVRRENEIPVFFAFECKQYSPNRKIGVETMRALLGTVSAAETKANMGVLVTTSSFTSGSKDFIASETLVDGKDFSDLVRWIEKVKLR